MGSEKTLSGVVLGSEGKGVQGVRLLARPTRWPAGATPFSQAAHASTRSEADGSFRLAGLGDEEYAVSALVPATLVADPVVAAAGVQGLTVRLRERVSAGLSVVEADGRPVPGASISLVPVGMDPRDRRKAEHYVELPPELTTDASGRATYERLDPEARFDLVVGPPSTRDDMKSATLASWTPKDQRIVLETFSVITGVVQDPKGVPIPKALVHWRGPRGGGSSAWTADDGSFVIKQVPTGEWFLSASMRGWESPRVPGPSAHRTIAGTRGVVLTLDPGIELTVLAENVGPGSFHATLHAEGEGRKDRLEASATDGVLTFRGVEPDRTYLLAVSPVEGMSLIRSGIRSQLTPLRVRLQPGRSITGRVIAPKGATDVKVGFNDGRISANGTVNPDGAFEITGLPAGTYDVNAWARIGEVQLHGHAAADAGGHIEITVVEQ